MQSPLTPATVAGPALAGAPAPASAKPDRLASIDAYRGFVMLLIMAEQLRTASVAKALPASSFWHFLAEQQEHVVWTGAVLHDMIQPSFSFLVGAALPFSMANRRARGESPEAVTHHAFLRALILIALGVILRTAGYTFEDTLSQIGLGYGFLYLIALRSVRAQWIVFAAILIGYWIAFAAWPLPGPHFDWAGAGVAPDFVGNATGFAAHWNKNTNLAWAFDTWFLNLFPREKPFRFNQGGYATLSFIPTLGTMILGLIAGEILRSDRRGWAKVRWMIVAGGVGIAAGCSLGAAGICPVVKRIWTPSWVLFSGGWCFLLLAAFYTILDVFRSRRWALPLVVVGMNSIAAYTMDHLLPGFFRETWQNHVTVSTPAGPRLFGCVPLAYNPLVLGVCVIASLWLILFWMHRKRLFLRI